MRQLEPIPPALRPGDAAFLDFDGTLVAIAPRPDAIAVPPALVPALHALHRRLDGAVAVVSGRSLGDLEAWLAGFPGALAGSHGGELRGAGGQGPDGAVIAALHDAARRAAAAAGLVLEVKAQGAAFHFRDRPERAAAAAAQAEALAAAFPGFAVQPAKMACEVKPAGARKDLAVARLLGAPPFAGRRPVYAGDDATDEPAMAWVDANGGVAVKVGPGPSAAPFRLDGPAAVLAWLRGEGAWAWHG